MGEIIKLSHGDGGVETQWLIKNVFYPYFHDPNDTTMADSYVFEVKHIKLAFTTDSFVVKPLFYRGGDIGKLSVCGTINDLVTAGAKPLFLSAGFILEEGFDIEKLHLIAKSMGDVCKQTGVRIVTGDTKVVERGSVDGIFINTAGIGAVSALYSPCRIEPEDEIIITGGIAEHGTSILIDRYELQLETNLKSDCAPMCSLIEALSESFEHVKLMKDPTRGGLATALNEIAFEQGLDIELDEEAIPIKEEVRAINDILGTDPMYLACEGRMIIVVRKGRGEKVLQSVCTLENRSRACIIGRFTSSRRGMVYMKTSIGGKYIVPALDSVMLPRIC